MKISIITLFPEMIRVFFNHSIIKRAQEKNLAEIEIVNLRQFAIDDYGTVDDRPYGGGAGMVLRIEPIDSALRKVKNPLQGKQKSLMGQAKVKTVKTVITSPKGQVFNQQKAIEYSKVEHMIIIAGHYEAVDERVMNYVDEEVSMGDFVMTGGEITAAAIVDAVVRLIPGVLKKEDATVLESFMEVNLDTLIKIVGSDEVLNRLKSQGITKVKLLEYPHYTRPEEFDGKKVPEVLMSGNHKDIERWRLKKAYKETLIKRQDLLSRKST